MTVLFHFCTLKLLSHRCYRDFTSAVSTIPNGSVSQPAVFFNPLPASEEAEDEFGDFCSPPAPPAATTNNLKPQPNYNIDLDSVESLPVQIPWSSPAAGEVSKAADEEEEFSDFASSAPPVIPCTEEEEFSQFESAAPVMTDLLNSPLNPVDSFPSPAVGGAGPPVINLLDSPDQLEDASGKDLPVQPGLLPVIDLLDSPDRPAVEEDEEFSHFASAEPLPALDLLDAIEPVDLPVLSFPPAEVSVKDQDDFGDFTQALDQSSVEIEEEDEKATRTTEQETEAIPTIEDSGAVQQVSTSDVNAESAEIDWDGPVQEPDLDLPAVREEPEGCQDDDFGDFAAASEVSSSQVVEDGPEVKEAEEECDEFGEFAGQPDTRMEEDDEFDDFEAAPPVAEASAPCDLTPEGKIQRVFANIFPVIDLERDGGGSKDPPLSPLKSRAGPIWSYASQLDSTPALSFSWRNSTAHQRFLQALRIDSVLQPMV